MSGKHTVEELEAIVEQLRVALVRNGIGEVGLPTIEDSDDARIAASEASLKQRQEWDELAAAAAADAGIKPEVLDAAPVGVGTAEALNAEHEAEGWAELLGAQRRAALQAATPVRVAGDARPECELSPPPAVAAPVPVVVKLPEDPLELENKTRFWAEIVREMGGFERVPEAYRKPVQEYFAARGIIA